MKILRSALSIAILLVLIAAAPAVAGEPRPQRLDDLRRIASQGAVYMIADATPAQVATPDPYQCTLYPSVVHFRTSSGRRSVGAKPYTTCLAGTPTLISQTSTLYIVEWAGAAYKPMASTTVSARGSRNLTQKNVEWFCVNGNSSRFQQETKGYSVQAGNTYHSVATTPRVDLACGY